MSNNNSDNKKFSKLFKVGDNIQRALDIKGESQAWLARQLTKKAHKEGYTDKNYGRAHVNRWCNNRNVPSTQNMERIGEILGYSVKELVTGNFGAESFSGDVDFNDPIISKKIKDMLVTVESCCQENNVSKAKTNKYRKLVRSEINSIIQYIIG